MKTIHIIVLAAAGIILAACAKPQQPVRYSQQMINARMSAWYNKDNCVVYPNANSTNGIVTPEQMENLRKLGVNLGFLTLHVGLGTFRPVKTERIEDHVMHSEYYSIGEDTAKLIRETKAAGKRVVAVGTTSIRTLESAAVGKNEIYGKTGETSIFIYPGYDFKIVDAVITNFHLPKSTLIMLISAFAGREFTLEAYREAVKEKYRFFSFGDAMFIIRPGGR